MQHEASLGKARQDEETPRQEGVPCVWKMLYRVYCLHTYIVISLVVIFSTLTQYFNLTKYSCTAVFHHWRRFVTFLLCIYVCVCVCIYRVCISLLRPISTHLRLNNNVGNFWIDQQKTESLKSVQITMWLDVCRYLSHRHLVMFYNYFVIIIIVISIIIYYCHYYYYYWYQQYCHYAHKHKCIIIYVNIFFFF